MWFFKKKNNPVAPVEDKKETEVIQKKVSIEDFLIQQPVADEEKELVSLITSCIVASDQPKSKTQIKSVSEIDIDKEMAVVLVSTILAQDYPQSQFRCVKVEERGIC